jgi:formylglycine-generating enzyme required for sulfatase activity/DNA polymerase III delta prime subunit
MRRWRKKEKDAMDTWLTLLTALGPGLAKALYDVGKEVVFKPLTRPAAEQVSKIAHRRYDALVDDAKVRTAVEEAVKATGLARWKDWADYPLRAALDRMAGEDQEKLRKRIVAVALAMTEESEEQVPETLLQALNVQKDRRADLARFLWAFRQALARVDEDYLELIKLATADESLNLLREIATGERVIRVRPVRPDQREIEARYLRSLVESECRFLPLGGRDPRVSAPTGLPMHLEKVYIALNTTERPPEAGKEMPPFREAMESARMGDVSALRVFLDRRHLLLLGEPGSGKTTFADHLALCLAGERWKPGEGWADRLTAQDATWEGPPPLPIRLRLRDFATDTECLPPEKDKQGRAEHLLAYTAKALAAGHYGENLPQHALDCLDQGNALLILDGLDEVGDPVRREQVAQAIVDLAQRRCRRARTLVTCRVRQYPLDSGGCPLVDWALPGFYVVTLANFDRDQIEAFIAAWFSELHAQKRFSGEVRDQKVTSLIEAVDLRPNLQEIAQRPILLTQMALVHDIEGELPGTRVQLYAQCADLLLWKWEQLRAQRAGRRLTAEDFIRERMALPGLQKGDFERALDHAVYDAHAEQGAVQEGPTNIPEETLRQRLSECLARTGLADHEALSKAQLFITEYLGLRNGLIVPAGEQSFQTPHRTFQEFLAARWLQSQRGFDRKAPRLVRENYDLWREVFLLAVGQARLGDAVDAIDVLCPSEWPQEAAGWSYLILTGQGLSEIGLPRVRSDERGPEVEKRIFRLLQETMQDLAPTTGRPHETGVPVRTRYDAGEVLDELGWLPDDLHAWVPCPGCAEVGGDLMAMRYPVTNAQYERFMLAGGYENPAWWSEEGWQWRVESHPDYRGEGPVTEPEFWHRARLGQERRGFPVVGVSWYEAGAFCRWLTDLLRRARADATDVDEENRVLVADLLAVGATDVRLPTEGEWETMAGGTEAENRYPWDPPAGPVTKSKEAILVRANTSEPDLGGPSPVGMYPLGASQPFGLMDLAGNVWEWTWSRWEASSDRRVVRGGSWSRYREYARCAVRRWSGADYSDPDLGFRCVSPGCSGS